MSLTDDEDNDSAIVQTKEHNNLLKLTIQTEVRTPLKINSNEEPYFVIQKLETTPAFKNGWLPQFITCVPDPLGIHGETLIGQRRTERPKIQTRHIPTAGFDENTIRTLFPILIKSENIWLLSNIIEDIKDPNSLGWLYEELDRIKNDPMVMELQKKILLNHAVPKDILIKNCIFCHLESRKIIDTLRRPDGVLSINNDFPFGPIMHKVLILQTELHDILEVSSEHISGLYDLLFQIVQNFDNSYQGEKLDAISYGMNYGLSRLYKGKQVLASGASQIHIHSQVTGINGASFNSGDKVGNICKAYNEQYSRDYLGDYISALKKANLVIEEDKNAILYIPIAQRFNYELQIMVKDKKVGNILETTPEIRNSIAYLEYIAYMIYQHEEFDVSSFNTFMHSTRFSIENDYGQRLIISIYPRTTIIAFSELGGRYVVDSFPWEIAAKMQGIKQRILEIGIKNLKVLVIGAHPDDIELGCAGMIAELKKRNHEVHALIVTDGCGGDGRDPDVRKTEANNAAEILGINTVAFGRIRDGQAYGDTLYNLIGTHIALRKPDIIITHAHIESEHTDHKSVSDAVQSLCARQTPRIYPLMFEVPAYRIDQSFRPTLYVNIEQSKDKKLEAISKHESEISRKTIRLEDIESRSRQRGVAIGDDLHWVETFMYKAPAQDLSKLFRLIPFAKGLM